MSVYIIVLTLDLFSFISFFLLLVVINFETYTSIFSVIVRKRLKLTELLINPNNEDSTKRKERQLDTRHAIWMRIIREYL